jgi:hypothetical protein
MNLDPDGIRTFFCIKNLYNLDNIGSSLVILHFSVVDPDSSDPLFLGLLDPDPLVRVTDPDPGGKNSKKNLDSCYFFYFFDFFLTFYL